jgi:cytoskeletal protein RodZ
MPVSAYNATQVERLREIGQYLKQVREERQLSLEEVSAHTRIQTRLLRALEAGDVAELPEPIYVQGFLRQYATLLELPDLDLSELDLAPRLTKTAPVRGEVGSPLRPFHLYVTYFALILGAIAVLSYVLRPSNSSHSVAPAPSPTSVTPTPATPSPPVAVSPSPQVTPKPTELRVHVELTGQSWLQVVADGQVVFEGILNPGATETWTAKQTLVLAAGNAGEVRVRVNEGAPQPLGKPGEVKEVTLTLDNPTLPTPTP